MLGTQRGIRPPIFSVDTSENVDTTFSIRWGWDAFGLPAEQYALSTGTHPAITTAKNVENFTRQIKALGFSYDWDREVNTTDPEYYRWTQWIFTQLSCKGLAYIAEVPVNWCPELGTVRRMKR